MLNIVFLDTINWDYDVATPRERPLGGSQSALCYLAVELARRGHRVTLLNNIRQPRDVLGVSCRPVSQVPREFFASRFDAVVALNGPAELCLQVRGHLTPGTPLVLWTQHAADQPAMQGLRRPEVQSTWSVIVCVSDWHRRTMIEHYALDPSRVTVLRNAIAPTFENLFPNREALVEAKAGPPTLAYTSTPFRGLDVLMGLFPAARREFPDLRLQVFSSLQVYQTEAAADPYGPLYDLCRTTPGVEYTGSVPQAQLAEALRRTSILAYPNTFPETSCIAVMEAMAAGLAVVTTEQGALPETTMGGAALVPHRGDPGSFSRDYLARLKDVLQRRTENPAGFSGAFFEQVQAINAACTWRARAVEWENAVHSWLAAQAERTDMTQEQALVLARTHFQAGRLAQAETVCRLILQHFPQDAEAHRLLGLVAYHAGQSEAAAQLLQQAISLNPQMPEYYENLSVILQALGRNADAAAVARQGQTLRPTTLEGWFNLGRLALAQNRFADAVEAFRQILTVDANRPDVENNLGYSLQALGRNDEAESAYRRSIALRPNYAEAHYNLGTLLQRVGRLEDARVALEQALTLNPALAEAGNNLGNTLQGLGLLEEAITAYQRALAARPNFGEAANNLGNALQIVGRLEEAAGAFRVALQSLPGIAEIENNLGFVLLAQGRLDEALEQYRRAMALKPAFALAHSNALLTEHYRPTVTLAGLARVHTEWDERHAAPLRSTWRPFANARDPERPLRLGLVSADFGLHPVGFFIPRALEALDRQQCATFIYSDRVWPDDFTRRIRAAATSWRDISSLSDEELAERIRADGIDLLVDLAGHTAANRLLMFARKPAPIQLTWMGYVGTTGLQAIDYLIADWYHVPEGAEVHYREKVLRLPDGYICYDPPAEAPAVGPLPAQERGSVAFASFSNPAKINPEVVALWSQILRRVPGSRLTLQYIGFGDEGNQRQFVERFAAHGVEAAQLDMRGKLPHRDLLKRYQEVDIALDPFPYSGGLTTCESLWMGVPVITCPGETFASRHAFSHLSNAGLAELVAKDHADYVERAVALAHDLPRLAALRAELRERVAASPLCDGPRFARNLLAGLRDIWREWVIRAAHGASLRAE